MAKSKKQYSLKEKYNFFEGIRLAKEDFSWCAGNKEKIKWCISTRKAMKDLCISRKDKNGVSFQNGYLYFFNKKNKR